MRERVYLALLVVLFAILIYLPLSESGYMVGLSPLGIEPRYTCPDGEVVSHISECTTCGDGLCESSESCYSCEYDCGTCPPEMHGNPEIMITSGSLSYEVVIRGGSLIRFGYPEQRELSMSPYELHIPIMFIQDAEGITASDAVCSSPSGPAARAPVYLARPESPSEGLEVLMQASNGDTALLVIGLPSELLSPESDLTLNCNAMLSSAEPSLTDTILIRSVKSRG